MSRGLLITLEGVEGAGKSTLQTGLAESLTAAGYDVLCTREPGATKLGTALRDLLLHGDDAMAQRAELFLYLADRAEHVEQELNPAVAAGKVVLCDRFTESTIAYQGYGRGLDLDAVKQACRFAQPIVVDRTYILDLDPAHGLQRVARRGGEADRLEREAIEFHQRVRDGFLKLAAAEPDRIVVVDAAQQPQEIVQRVLSDLRSRVLP